MCIRIWIYRYIISVHSLYIVGPMSEFLNGRIHSGRENGINVSISSSVLVLVLVLVHTATRDNLTDLVILTDFFVCN